MIYDMGLAGSKGSNGFFKMKVRKNRRGKHYTIVAKNVRHECEETFGFGDHVDVKISGEHSVVPLRGENFSAKISGHSGTVDLIGHNIKLKRCPERVKLLRNGQLVGSY